MIDFSYAMGALRFRVLGGILGLLAAGSTVAQAQARRTSSTFDAPTFQRELTYGVNFNTNGGMIGGAMFRSTRMISADWARFWMIEAVEVKHPKEQRLQNLYSGGIYVPGKMNYAFVLRPSVGAQRVVFRKAPDSGVQVSALASAGPSVALMMPYYIYYDYTKRDNNGRPIGAEDIRAEQYDPDKHPPEDIFIYDRAPLFSGASEIKPQIGGHVRGALTFEYGRYRDAIAGVETGFLFEAYPKQLSILGSNSVDAAQLNNNYFTSVYLTIYIGTRK
ncbi:hypothetical protein LRS06_11960 [Hymenobacter sp. J193]|uniref:hypothetical protein n=1 Tax=Hymenobacter sp. J193 TaxID=2898429 RepID=UPI002151D926|nr:hypothetical protein [Hymenobacter sp. J193]MCR5888468.1 hypothetical protein [Hymenobacter sp. J193]